MAQAEARQPASASIDVSDPRLYQDDTWRPLFAQLRRDDPVHYCEASRFGPYWSVTRYDDISAVELDHQNYSSSSELGGIQVTGVLPSSNCEFSGRKYCSGTFASRSWRRRSGSIPISFAA